MSFLARALAPRGVKAVDQVSNSANGVYLPLDNYQTWTGMGLSAEAALNYIAVYQCVRVLSNVFAQLPLKLYRRRADGGKDEATDHPLYRTLHLSPNPEMTSFVWRKLAMRHLATWGNHFSEIVRGQFGTLELWPIRPDRVIVDWGPNGTRRYTYLGPTGQRKELRPGTVFHMQGQTTDGLIGSSPLAELRRTLQVGQSAEAFARGVFENNARPGVLLQHPNKMSAEAIERLTAQVDRLRGSKNANKTVLLEEGLTAHEIGFPPEDALFLQAQLTSHRFIYGAYGVPPHKVGDLERATFSNIEHQALEFIQDGALPWLVNAEQEFAVQLIEDDDVFAEFLVDGYLRGDAKSRSEALQIQRNSGIINGDEWRALENMNPIPDGSGQTYWMPVNYTAAIAPGDLEAEAEPEPEPVVDEVPPQLVAVKAAGAAAVRCRGYVAVKGKSVACNRPLGIFPEPYHVVCTKCGTTNEAGMALAS